MSHIAILTHSEHRFAPMGYLLAELVTIWRERGMRVTLLHGLRQKVDADALFLHVDLTRVPSDYLHFVEQYPVVVNRSATDISKRRISRSLVDPRSEHAGSVIVKTDLNCRGLDEGASAKRMRRYGQTFRSILPSSWQRRSSLRQYRIFDSIQNVPPGVWRNPNLVVERFLPERRNGRYCLRTWLFLGDRERIALFYSDNPVVKSTNIIGREPLTDVPPELREMRRELGFDFGKFDYVIVDGRPVLFDANTTPTLGAIPREQYLPWLGQLADGIWKFLPARTS